MILSGNLANPQRENMMAVYQAPNHATDSMFEHDWPH
jgi:hypothetical protein